MTSDLNRDPDTITQALLQTIVVSLNASATSSLLVSTTPAWTGPSSTTIWVQSLLYVSLACSLFAALAAVLGKQWLSHYQNIGVQGNDETCGLERQRKFDALQTWYLRAILDVIPVLLQLSLLLFGAGLCGYIWVQQRTIAIVTIIANGAGALFYFSVVFLSLCYEDCPYQSPMSRVLRHCGRPIITTFRSFRRSLVSYRPRFHASPSLRNALYAYGQAWTQRVRRYVRLSNNSRRTRRSLHTKHGDVESQSSVAPKVDPHEPKNEPFAHAALLDGSDELGFSDAVRWLLTTSTDTQIRADTCLHVCTISWSRGAVQRLPVQVLSGLLSDIHSCFAASKSTDGPQLYLMERYSKMATSFISAFLFLFWEKLADSYEETRRWVDKVNLDSFCGLQYPGVPLHGDLYSLARMLEETVQFLRRDHDNPCPVFPIISVRFSARADTETLCVRTLLYLAKQATYSHDRSRISESWTARSLRRHQLRILDVCNSVCRTEAQDAVHMAHVYAALIAISTLQPTVSLFHSQDWG